MIGITAKYIGDEERTLLSGGQFYIVDEKEQKHEAVYGEFSSKDLLLEWLEPNKPVEKTTQFDIPFDEEKNVQNNCQTTKRTINCRYSCNLYNKLLIGKIKIKNNCQVFQLFT